MVDLEMNPNGLVTLRYHMPYVDEDERSYLDSLHHIGRIEEPFVLLCMFGDGRSLSPAGEREQALWFKANRATMRERCKAIAIVRDKVTPQSVEVFRKLFEVPLIGARDEREAKHFLETVVGRHL